MYKTTLCALVTLAILIAVTATADTPQITSQEAAQIEQVIPNFDLRSKQTATSVSDAHRLRVVDKDLEIRWSAEQTPRVLYSRSGALTRPSLLASETIARRFLREHVSLYRVEDTDLRLSANYRTRRTGARHLTFKQYARGLEVFGADVKLTLDRDGRVVFVTSGLAPKAASLASTQPLLSADEAVRLAAENLGLTTSEVSEVSRRLVVFMLTPEEPRLAWRVRLEDLRNGHRYDLIIDDAKATVLLRHSLTWYFADTPSYRVYAGHSPQPNMPFLSLTPPFVDRVLVSTQGDPTASPAGWLNLANPVTSGNNVLAREDRLGNNTGGRTARAQNLSFDFPLILNTIGQEPENFTDASITNLFYRCNWIHDYLYRLGFDEQAGNFQVDNFGRGGLGNDPVVADAQDGSRFNNASFGTSEDGFPGRMQMYLWTTAQPKVDGSFDSEVIIHEYVHGLTTRLVGGPQEATSLFGIQSGGMGEGWSDWYAMTMLSGPGDDPDAKYPFGSYVSRNFERGIRRFAYSTNMDVNPLTYADIDPAQTRFNPADTDSVHRTGEVWASALWTARSEFIKAYGFEQGKALIEQIVTDGLKLTPTNPSFVDARDAILAADRLANDGVNQCLLWSAFARRGIGFGASALNGSTNAVRQSFATAPYCSREGSVSFDRTAYTDGSTITLTLGDLDLIGQEAAQVLVTSTATGDSETVTLKADSAIPGLFSGSVALTFADAAAGDGKLQSGPGDTIRASFAEVTAQARAVREVTVFEDAVNKKEQFTIVSDWRLTKAAFKSPSKSLTDSKKGNYRDNANSIVEIARKFDFTETAGARLVFQHKYAFERGFDFGYVDVRVGDGLWVPVAAFTGFQNDFSEASIDLSGFDGRGKISIRFRLSSDGGVTADGWYIDDIRIISGSLK